MTDRPAFSIRPATAQDAAACAAIYAAYVLGGPISFEYVPPPAEEMAERIAHAHRWLVAEQDGRVLGYAYGAPHHERTAYSWAADVSIYLAEDQRGKGIGRTLYEALFELLYEDGICVVCAGITQPNPASNGLHAALGFEPSGTFRRIGFKQGSWHDVLWMQKDLRDVREGEPPQLR